MAQKELNPLLKLLLELGPLVVYFWAYRRYADQALEVFGQSYSGVTAATIIFVPVMLIGMAISWVLTRHLPRMVVFTALMVVVFGLMTAYFNDDRFTKMRPAIIYSLFAAVLAFGLWLRKTSYLEYLMGDAFPLTHTGWMLLTRNFVFFFIAMVAINEFTWRILGDGAWVFLDSFGQMILTMVFFVTQMALLRQHIDQSKLED